MVWWVAVSSSGEGVGFSFLGGGGGLGEAVVDWVSKEAAAARAASSTSLTLTRVNSTKERMSSACVARRVLNGNPRLRGSLCRRTCPSYGPNSVRLLELPVALTKMS